MPLPPFPAFLWGFIVPLAAAHILYLPFAALASFAGYGLLRLNEPARLLTMAFLILGVCPAALAVLPWYQSQLQTYTARVIRLIPSMPGQTPPPVTYSSPLLFFSCIMGLILHGFVFWLLHRHRAAFQAPAPTSEPILEA